MYSRFVRTHNTATAGIYVGRLPEVGKHAFKLPPAVVT